MIAGVEQYLASRGRAAALCGLCFLVSACSDDGTTGAAGTGGADAGGDARGDVTRPDSSDGATLDAAGGKDSATEAGSDAGSDAQLDAPIDADGDASDSASDSASDAATDATHDAGIDAADAHLPDASDGAADAAPRCATLDCDDGIACTVDGCDETLGCTHAPSDALCDDNRVCSGSETCNAATGCEPGTPLDCNDSNRCTFDYCSEPAAGCVHHDVSTSVELLLNADFDYGDNLGWRQLPPTSGGSFIWEDPDLAHTPDWFAWLGGISNLGIRVWQAVDVPAETAELTLSGVYGLIPGSGTPSLSSYFRIEISDGLTGADYERALSLGSSQTTPQSWIPFSLTTSEPHAGKVLEITIASQNAANDLTNFFVDSLSLRAKVCPAQ